MTLNMQRNSNCHLSDITKRNVFNLDFVTLSQSCVCIVGGVGSHAAHILARLGIRNQRFIDFTQVNLSSLNGHAYATLEDITTIKVMSIKQFLEKVVGWGCVMNAKAMMYKPKTIKLDYWTIPNSISLWMRSMISDLLTNLVLSNKHPCHIVHESGIGYHMSPYWWFAKRIQG